jgi:hypothetical protein
MSTFSSAEHPAKYLLERKFFEQVLAGPDIMGKKSGGRLGASTKRKWNLQFLLRRLIL